MTLEAALAQALSQRHLILAGLTREAKNRIRILFSSGGQDYWSALAEVPADPGWNAVQLDDALFDEAVGQVDYWRAMHGR